MFSHLFCHIQIFFSFLFKKGIVKIHLHTVHTVRVLHYFEENANEPADSFEQNELRC